MHISCNNAVSGLWTVIWTVNCGLWTEFAFVAQVTIVHTLTLLWDYLFSSQNGATRLGAGRRRAKEQTLR